MCRRVSLLNFGRLPLLSMRFWIHCYSFMLSMAMYS